VQELARPIPSRRLRRITFIPTTLSTLLRANEVCDLWSRGADQGELWSALTLRRQSTRPRRGTCEPPVRVRIIVTPIAALRIACAACAECNVCIVEH